MRVTNSLPIRILSHNIRYATDSPFKGEELWKVRKTGLINELRLQTLYNQESFVCLQEVLHSQLLDIHSGLNEELSATSTQVQEWSYVGVGRDDGQQAGEYSPIFYRPAVWECLLFKNIWLSETPDEPSKSWDAASIRILTVGLFKHQGSKKQVLAMNTHLDDQGSESRYEAAKIILHTAKQFQGSSGTSAVFLAGDLNSNPQEEAYQVLNDPSSQFADMKHLTASGYVSGHQMTFTGFVAREEPLTRIDFIHIDNPATDSASGVERLTDRVSRNQWAVKSYTVLENRFDDGIYISDHRAVVGDLLLI